MAALVSFSCYCQPECYFNLGVFNTPQNQPFIETYLTISGNSLFAREVNGKFQNSVNILFTVFKDSLIVKANKYNLSGPLFNDSVSAPVFIDNQRYPLPNGNYRLEIALTDNYNPAKKPFIIKQDLSLAYQSKNIQCSSIQALESYRKSEKPGPLTKSGFDMIPYTVNYFPETSNDLTFYFETYNTDTVLGKNKAFVYYYYIENSDNLTKLNDYGAFKKQTSAKVNPLLAKINISKLGTGNYNLVIGVKDEKNIMHVESKYFFRRLNRNVDITALAKADEQRTIAEYFGNCNNPDTLKMFVECLWPIANGVDKERTINQSLKKNPEMMKNFVIDFWQRRAGDTANAVKMWATYYKSVKEAMALFRCGKQPGYYSDRGRVYLQYGKPNQRAEQNMESNTYPYEIWQYYQLTDAVNGTSFTNRKFVFVNKMLGDDCHRLIHSDTPGEMINERWRFDVLRKNDVGEVNPDNTMPSGSGTNQFNEIYSNPR
ncbi:MAG: GWxTD domain-containing protein [Bacteroidota bacterium]